MRVLASEPEEEQVEQLEGKVAVVTGAASGMGRAFAERFVQEGMKVVLADVEAGALETAVSELRDAGGDVVGVRTDVSRLEEVEALAARTIDAFGAVHVVCNNAGVESGATFADIPAETWDWVLGVDLLGTIYGIKTFLPLLREHAPDGHIVNTSSIAGLDSYFLTAAPYVAAKHAVVGLSLSLRAEAAGLGIRVSALCPGTVDTPLLSKHREKTRLSAAMEVPTTSQSRQWIYRMLPAPYSADRLAVDALKGIDRNAALIVAPRSARIQWIAARLSPALNDRIGNALARQATGILAEGS